MKFPFRLPWRGAAGHAKTMPESKAFTSGFMTFSGDGKAGWHEKGYAALAREGFMKNPVAHRSIRLVAEAAASVPWQLMIDGREQPEHAVLALLAAPNGRQSGAELFEALYGQMLISGNGFVLPVRAGTGWPNCICCGPTGCASSKAPMAGRRRSNIALAAVSGVIRRLATMGCCISSCFIHSTTMAVSGHCRRPRPRSISPTGRPNGTRR